MERLLVMLLAALAFAIPAMASPIQLSAFGQTSGNNTVIATQNAAMTATNILVVNAQVGISQLFGQATPIIAGFNLVANSIDAAQTAFGLVVQHYSGSFCLTSAAACGGTDYLSGTFSDAAIGALGGPGLVVNVSSPPDTLVLASSMIPVADLQSPSTFNLSFSNVNPKLAICGSTLCSFDASFSGTVSSSTLGTVETSEPATLAMMFMGLLGLAFLTPKKKERTAGLATA